MIPSTAHFIWFGDALPWVHVAAIRSALQVGGVQRAVLHHDSDLSGNTWWSELDGLDGFEARPLDAAATLSTVPDIGAELVEVYAALSQPAARANMVRAAILHAEGGIYLDLDTVTVAPFDDLLGRDDFFCGEEPIAYPATILQGRNPIAWGGALARDGLRDALRRLPDGWRAFRRVQGIYHDEVNNAVVGCPAGHPFVARLLQAMLEVPVERRTKRYELGTSLLQNEVAAWEGPGLVVYPPEVFYPLGPGISEHWFRATRRAAVDEVITPRTVVAHWYASVRTKHIVPRIDPDWVRAHASTELYSALVTQLGLV